MTQEQKNNFNEDLQLCLEDSNFLLDVYNYLRIEEERFIIRDLQSCKKLIIDLGYKVEIKHLGEYHGKRAIITH